MNYIDNLYRANNYHKPLDLHLYVISYLLNAKSRYDIAFICDQIESKYFQNYHSNYTLYSDIMNKQWFLDLKEKTLNKLDKINHINQNKYFFNYQN